MNHLDILSAFGLTRQEAQLYLCLLSEGDLNGYELCKSTGISRSNVYTGLTSLVAQGAAWLIEGESTRYRAVPAAEFTSNRLRSLEALRAQMLTDLPPPRRVEGGYITIKGTEAIIDRLRNLIQEAKERLYLSLERGLLIEVWDDLQAKALAGVKIVAITDSATAKEIGLANARITLYAGEPKPEQVRLIIDSNHVLTGEITGGANATCLYSSQKNLVDLFKDAMKNEIKLIELGKASNSKEDQS